MSSVEGQDVSASASTSQTKAAKPNGNKNNSKGGKGGPRQDAPPTVQLSKALSYILRHGAAKEGLKVRPDGYLSLTAVLARPKVSKLKMEHGGSPTEEDVLAVVNSNDKKRFEVKGGGKDETEEKELLIRAVQGHSISEITALDHVPLTLSNLAILSSTSESNPDDEPKLPQGVEILHGTNRDAWEKIKASGGLSKMKRNHIHLAKGRPGSDSVISGMRNSSAIILHIDLIKALRSGIPFSLASNGAVLTSGVEETGLLPLTYISRAEDTKIGTTIWEPPNEN